MVLCGPAAPSGRAAHLLPLGLGVAGALRLRAPQPPHSQRRLIMDRATFMRLIAFLDANVCQSRRDVMPGLCLTDDTRVRLVVVSCVLVVDFPADHPKHKVELRRSSSACLVETSKKEMLACGADRFSGTPSTSTSSTSS